MLRETGCTAQVSDVFACLVPDRPGGLSELLTALSDRNISVEYLYSFVRAPGDQALILFRFSASASDADIAAVLSDLKVETLTHEQVLAFAR